MQFILVVILVLSVWNIPARLEASEPQSINQSTTAYAGPSRDEVAGHYAAVSESEWNLELWLNPDGTAEVLSERWEAGHHDQRTIVRHNGSWSVSGDNVEIRYSGLRETLKFNPAMSFAEFGAEGEAPGLEGQNSSVSNNLFIGISLWRAERLQSIYKVK